VPRDRVAQPCVERTCFAGARYARLARKPLTLLLGFVRRKKSGGAFRDVESEQGKGMLAQAVLEGQGASERRAGW